MWPLFVAIPILLFALYLYFFGMHSIEGESEFIHLIYGFFAVYVIVAGFMVWLMPKPSAPSDVGALVEAVMSGVSESGF